MDKQSVLEAFAYVAIALHSFKSMPVFNRQQKRNLFILLDIVSQVLEYAKYERDPVGTPVPNCVSELQSAWYVIRRGLGVDKNRYLKRLQDVHNSLAFLTAGMMINEKDTATLEDFINKVIDRNHFIG